jgi:hypothetical protein
LEEERKCEKRIWKECVGDVGFLEVRKSRGKKWECKCELKWKGKREGNFVGKRKGKFKEKSKGKMSRILKGKQEGKQEGKWEGKQKLEAGREQDGMWDRRNQENWRTGY